MLRQISWFRIILDEAHEIRNSSTLAFKAIEALRAERRWCLTGTPVHNKLSDLFSLAKFLRYYPFADPSIARKLITHPLQNGDRKGLDHLQSMMKLFSLRRVKDLSQVPKLHECMIPVELSDSERQDYNFMKKGALSELVALARSNITKTQHITFLLELRLRQICCHGLLREQDLERLPSFTTGICSKCGSTYSTIGDYARDSNPSVSALYCSSCSSQFSKISARQPSPLSTYDGPTVKFNEEVQSQQQPGAVPSKQQNVSAEKLSSKLAAVISKLTHLHEVALIRPHCAEKR